MDRNGMTPVAVQVFSTVNIFRTFVLFWKRERKTIDAWCIETTVRYIHKAMWGIHIMIMIIQFGKIWENNSDLKEKFC